MLADVLDPLETIDEKTGKPPETRVRSVRGVRQRISEMRDAERTRSWRRAKVNGLLDGNPPYSKQKLRDLGRGEDANINLRTGEGTVDAAKTPYYDLWTSDVDRMINVDTDWGDDPQKWYEWSETISNGLHRLFDEKWDGMDNNMQRKQWQMCVHGIGIAMFEDTMDWRWKSRMVGDVLVKDDAEADIDLLDECAIPRTWLPTQLYQLIKNPKSAKGWNIELARKAIMNAAPRDFRSANQNNWEAYQDAIRTGDVSWNNKSNRIMIVDYLVKEFDGSITHTIVLDDGTPQTQTLPSKDDFLFQKIGRFESFSQVLCPFFFDVVGSGLWHGVKGLGPKIYDFCQLENRLTGKTIDQAMLGLVVVPKTADDWQTMETISAAGVTIFKPGTEFQQTKIADNLEGPTMVMRELQNMRQSNTGQYQQRVAAENQEPTLGQAQINAQQQAMLGKGSINRYYRSLDRLAREMVRRVFNPKLSKSDPGGKEAFEFREWCMDQGVPPECLKMENICRIKWMRSIGYGSPVMRELISNKLLSLVPTMDPRSARNALRTSLATYVGQDHVDRFFPPFDSTQTPGQQEQEATDENNALKMPGGETQIAYTDNHIVHFDKHFASAANTVQMLQGGQMDPMKALIHLHQSGVHMGAHLKGMRNDPTLKAQFAQRQQAWLQLSKVADQLQQQLEEHFQNQQAQGPPQPQVDPEALASIMKVQGDLKLKQMKAQGDMALKADKQQFTKRLKDLETAHKLRLSNVTALADATQPNGAAQPQKPPLNERLIESLNYKDAPPSIRRQMELQAGFIPATEAEVSPNAPQPAPSGTPS